MTKSQKYITDECLQGVINERDKREVGMAIKLAT
jgi:hypothetical protein